MNSVGGGSFVADDFVSELWAIWARSMGIDVHQP